MNVNIKNTNLIQQTYCIPLPINPPSQKHTSVIPNTSHSGSASLDDVKIKQQWTQGDKIRGIRRQL
jgi:hypothetical protein